MNSGIQFLPPVRLVEIPKLHECRVRLLGMPTIAGGEAQTVEARYLDGEGGVKIPRLHMASPGCSRELSAGELAI